jgi:hypothetical protein
MGRLRKAQNICFERTEKNLIHTYNARAIIDPLLCRGWRLTSLAETLEKSKCSESKRPNPKGQSQTHYWGLLLQLLTRQLTELLLLYYN